MTITEYDIEKSLTWLYENASVIAAAKGKSQLLEVQIKSVKADLMKKSTAMTIAAKEMEALASASYLSHIEATYKEVENYEYLRLTRDYHNSLIEAFRTLEASKRIFEKGVR